MNRILGVVATLFVVTGWLSSTAGAQATRTWVSGVGDDANPCSRTAPCKTFAGAISKTAAKGEINAIDPGGFGAVTITKSITISGEGLTAGILAAGTNGVIVNAAAADVVTLRGLDIDGAGTGLNGIRVLSAGKVLIEDSQIRNFTANGIDVQGNAANAVITVARTTISNNNGGINIFTNLAGVDFVVVDDSLIAGNVAFGVKADGANSRATLNRSVLNSGALSVQSLNGGVIQSYGNNVIRGGNPTQTLPLE